MLTHVIKKKKLDSPMIVFICFAGFVETQIAGPDSLFIIRCSVRGFHYRYCLQKEITSWRALSSTSFHILSVVFLLSKSSYQGKDWTVSHYWILLSIPLFIFLACLLKMFCRESRSQLYVSEVCQTSPVQSRASSRCSR